MTTLSESRRFEEHLTTCGTTAAGAQWVKTAVDPFHDVDLDVIGMPDSTSGRSVVYAVTSNLTLDAPPEVSGAWDCHVAFTPVIAKAKLNALEGAKKTLASSDEPASYFPGSAVYMSTNTIEETRDSHLLTACSVPSGEPTFFNKQKGSCEYQGLGVNEFLDADGSSIVRVTGAAFEVHNTTEELYKSGSVTTYRIAREADECNFTFVNRQSTVGATQDHYDTVAATVSNGPPTDAASAKRYNGHTWDAADGCLVPGVLDARQSDGQKSLPRLHLSKVESTQGAAGRVDTRYWAPVFTPDEQGLNDTYALGITPTRDELGEGTVRNITDPAYYGAAGSHLSRGSPPTIVPEMMVSGAYFSGLSNQTKLTLTLRVFVEVFPASYNSLVPLAHPSNPYDAKALQCYQEIMSHMRSGYRVGDNDSGDFFRKAIAVARTVGKTLMPIMPPNMAAAIKVADGVAAKAEKALNKAQKIEQAVKATLAESNKITPRVRNRARTKGRAMP